jgi:hypothetical protein
VHATNAMLLSVWLADWRGARASRAGPGFSSQTDKGPLFCVRGVNRTPKSKACVGDLPMPAALESRLRKHLSSRHYRKNDLGLLFANRRPRPFSANKLREKKLRPLLTKLRIPLAGFHAFRHAVASELIDSGAPITVVQAQLRHSDPRITLGLYGHVIPQSQRDAVGSFAARLADNTRKNRLQLLTRPRIADSIA